jgi:hypothetical protein
MSAVANERVTSPVPAAADAMPSDREAAACVLFGEIAEASGFYDLFQFLARAKWRGELIVQIEGTRRSVYFDEGHVVAAQSQAPSERIGEVLRRAGMLTGEQIDACVERQGDGSLRFGEAAVELGFIATEGLFRAMDRQLETIFNSIVAATKGSFYFFLGYDESTLSYRQKHKVDGLLVKSISRIEQEEYFRTRVPSWDHIPRRTSELEAPREDRLGIYGAIDGRRTVSQIRELCGGADDLEVMRALFELVQSGHVTVEPPHIGVGRVVEIYNEAIVFLLRELDAMDEGETIRMRLADFAKDAPTDLFGAGIPEDDGSFDAEAIARRAAEFEDGEERVGAWLYDYASFAIFLARPHLQRRDGDIPRDDLARVSKRVAALLAPLAPHGAPTEVPPSGRPIALVSGVPARKTMPGLAQAAAAKGTQKMPRVMVPMPGLDPTRTVRMKPISDEQIANQKVTAVLPPKPATHVAIVPPPAPRTSAAARARTTGPAGPLPAGTRAPGSILLTPTSLLALVILVAAIAAAVAIVMTRGM